MKRNETSSVIRQKDEYQNGYFKKKHSLANLPKNGPWYAQVRGEGGVFVFSENLARFVFLRFALALG